MRDGGRGMEKGREGEGGGQGDRVHDLQTFFSPRGGAHVETEASNPRLENPQSLTPVTRNPRRFTPNTLRTTNPVSVYLS